MAGLPLSAQPRLHSQGQPPHCQLGSCPQDHMLFRWQKQKVSASFRPAQMPCMRQGDDSGSSNAATQRMPLRSPRAPPALPPPPPSQMPPPPPEPSWLQDQAQQVRFQSKIIGTNNKYNHANDSHLAMQQMTEGYPDTNCSRGM